jgi:hypothetical protein
MSALFLYFLHKESAMTRAATATYLGEQLRNLRAEIAKLEQLADELVLACQTETSINDPTD